MNEDSSLEHLGQNPGSPRQRDVGGDSKTTRTILRFIDSDAFGIRRYSTGTKSHRRKSLSGTSPFPRSIMCWKLSSGLPVIDVASSNPVSINWEFYG